MFKQKKTMTPKEILAKAEAKAIRKAKTRIFFKTAGIATAVVGAGVGTYMFLKWKSGGGSGNCDCCNDCDGLDDVGPLDDCGELEDCGSLDDVTI